MANKLLSIDPGFRYFGYCVFNESNDIQEADCINLDSVSDWDKWTRQPPSFSKFSELIESLEWEKDCEAIIEFPQIHRDTPNPDDILMLTSACGAYTSILQSYGFKVSWVRPRAWKGTVPKKVMYNRILAKVKDFEYTKIKSVKNHNTIDAVGIGLWKKSQKY